MEIINKIFTMYGIAFCIAMFVAFIIWLLTFLMSNETILNLTRLSFYKNLFKKSDKPEIIEN